MTGYESDSSDGEFEETSVLLGYASKEADEDTVSKLGGYPVSPPLSQDLLVSVLTRQHRNGSTPRRLPQRALPVAKSARV